MVVLAFSSSSISFYLFFFPKPHYYKYLGLDMPPQLPSDALPHMSGRFLEGGALKLAQLIGTGSMGKVYSAIGWTGYGPSISRGPGMAAASR